MAAQPLIIQRPTLSLIGGKELPKASGAGVPTPDLTRGADAFLAATQRKDKENRQLLDQIEGQRYAEMEQADPMAAGKDANGKWTKLPPLPDGSPAFQASYFETRARNAAAGIRVEMSDNYNRIQSQFDKPVEQRAAEMKSYEDGLIEATPLELREQARTDSAAERESRGKAMVAQDSEQRYRAAVDGLDVRFEDAANEAVAAGLSGGDPAPALERALQAVDEKGALLKQTPEEVTSKKTKLTNYISAASTQSMMSTNIMAGNADLDAADQMALSLKSGGTGPETELVIDEDYEPTAFNDERERTGQTKVYRKITSTELQQKYGDPAIAAKMGERLQEVIDFKRRAMKDAEKYNEYWNTVKKIADTDVYLNQALRDEHEKVISDLITSGNIEKAGGMAMANQLIVSTKIVPASFLDYLEGAMLGANVDKAAAAVAEWRDLKAAKRGNADTGGMIYTNVPAEKRMRFDYVEDALNTMIIDGKPPTTEAWQAFVKDTNNPANSVDNAIGQFNQGREPGDSFNAQVTTRFVNDYGDFRMPPEMQSQMKVAFQIAFQSSTNPTPDEALDTAWEQVKKNWTQSEAFDGNFQPTDNPMKNPPGWDMTAAAHIGDRNVSTSNYAWLNDQTVNSIGLMDDNNQLVFSTGEAGVEERAEFQSIMADPDNALGQGDGKFVLKATSPNRRYTQYNVLMRTSQGDLITLKQRDAKGGVAPVVLDLEIVNAHLWSKASVKEATDKLEDTVHKDLDRIFYDQYSDAYGKATGMMPPSTLDWSDERRDEWIHASNPDYEAFWKQQKAEAGEFLRKGIQRENDKIVQVPAGTPVDPKTLRTRKMAGLDVTVAAIQQLEDVGLAGGDTSQFLLNIAAAESGFGTVDNTFRPSGDRGIWQINDGSNGAFRDIVARARVKGDPIYEANEKLKTIGVDIANIVPSDLEQPLVNAAVARLFLMTDHEQITGDLEQQGKLWKRKYNTYLGTGSVYGTAEKPGWMEKAGKVKMPERGIFAGDPSPVWKTDPSATGAVIDHVSGKPNPPQFMAMSEPARFKAVELSAAFGQPLKITAHGGTQPDARNATSQHKTGKAIDVYIGDLSDADRTRLISTAIAMGYKGVGGYAAGDGYNTLHFDIRNQQGGGPQGVALWWRKTPGVDGAWGDGPSWFVKGVNQGTEIIKAKRRG